MMKTSFLSSLLFLVLSPLGWPSAHAETETLTRPAAGTPSAETSATSPAFQDMEALYAQVQAFLKQNIGQQLRNPVISVRKFGRRMRLPACKTPVQLQLLQGEQALQQGGRLSLLAQCTSPFWKIFVSATIQGELPAVVAARVIPRKTPIGAEDITLRWLPARQRPRQALADPDAVIGLQARRNIRAGDIITARMLLPPYWVHRHKPVTLLTRIGTIEVRTEGIAQKDGVENDMVPVRNARSGKIVRGIVIAPDTVLVP